jgi:hypothetical protein
MKRSERYRLVECNNIDHLVSEEREQTKESEKKKEDKLKPNFELSGKLSEEARTTESGVVLKFAEPPDARIPSQRWRLYPFKEDKPLGNITYTQVFLTHYNRSYSTSPAERLLVWQGEVSGRCIVRASILFKATLCNTVQSC